MEEPLEAPNGCIVVRFHRQRGIGKDDLLERDRHTRGLLRLRHKMLGDPFADEFKENGETAEIPFLC